MMLEASLVSCSVTEIQHFILKTCDRYFMLKKRAKPKRNPTKDWKTALKCLYKFKAKRDEFQQLQSYPLHIQHKSISKHTPKVYCVYSIVFSSYSSPTEVQEILLPSKNLAGYCIIREWLYFTAWLLSLISWNPFCFILVKDTYDLQNTTSKALKAIWHRTQILSWVIRQLTAKIFSKMSLFINVFHRTQNSCIFAYQLLTSINDSSIFWSP